eukprot:7234700-Alexandrium_andersonii.AAC.1
MLYCGRRSFHTATWGAAKHMQRQSSSPAARHHADLKGPRRCPSEVNLGAQQGCSIAAHMSDRYRSDGDQERGYTQGGKAE